MQGYKEVLLKIIDAQGIDFVISAAKEFWNEPHGQTVQKKHCTGIDRMPNEVLIDGKFV